MPASGEEGLKRKVVEKPVGQVGLVLVHCWNLGEPGGPYPISQGERFPGEAADWVPEAHEVIAGRIGPVLEAARRAGIAVFHLAQFKYASRYAQYRALREDPEMHAEGPPPVEGCVRPRSPAEQWADKYGPDFPGPVWETHAGAFDIAEVLRPRPEEAVYLSGRELNVLCRRRDIDTLFYAGFMADLCLLNIPGAIREMAGVFKYRCVVLRDATTAYEYADTHEGGWMTRAAIRHVEADLGFSAASGDFIAAAEKASR